jgi:hypothetical protein
MRKLVIVLLLLFSFISVSTCVAESVLKPKPGGGFVWTQKDSVLKPKPANSGSRGGFEWSDPDSELKPSPGGGFEWVDPD